MGVLRVLGMCVCLRLRVAQALMRALGAEVLDATSVTQSQWESAYDGLHYLKSHYTGWWYGKVAGMVFQVALNTLFRECGEAEVASVVAVGNASTNAGD
jgi:hypothetical protein